jgi:rhodanese-related sulfurtransferase
MRRTLFILVGLLALPGFGLLAAPALTVSGLQKQMAAGAKLTLIDIRSPAAYAQEHIPGAINIPAALCPLKKLPPLGQVVVYDGGLGNDSLEAAAAALTAKPGINVEILEGGLAGWKNTQSVTTRGSGLKREVFNYITYAHLKSAIPDGVVLYDLRKPVHGSAPALTDLKAEFPGLKQAGSRAEALQSAAVASSLVVLIDSGDGTAEQEARRLKLSGAHNYVILAGGEFILSRHGQAGLQRNAAGATVVANKLSPPGAAN